MSNKLSFEEAFPGNESDPGPDYFALSLAVVLAFIVAVIMIALCIPLQ